MMRERILVTGATGYVGGRLVPKLPRRAYIGALCSCASERLSGYSLAGAGRGFEGDALERTSLAAAMQDVFGVHYLIHGRQGGKTTPGATCRRRGNLAPRRRRGRVKRIIYLGELWST